MKNNVAQRVIWFYKALSELIQLICKQGKTQELSFCPSLHIHFSFKLFTCSCLADGICWAGSCLQLWGRGRGHPQGSLPDPYSQAKVQQTGHRGGRFFGCFGANTIASWGRDLACVSWENRAGVSSPLPPSELDEHNRVWGSWGTASGFKSTFASFLFITFYPDLSDCVAAVSKAEKVAWKEGAHGRGQEVRAGSASITVDERNIILLY